MRHIRIDELLQSIFTDTNGAREKARLDRADRAVAKKPANLRATYINANGASKWSPLKNRFTGLLGNKCWYTEAELIGGSLTIDHFRPKSNYWFLAFKPDNYRVACPFANSPKHNPLYGCRGGKGDDFPLLDHSRKANDILTVKDEHPLLLDPCNEDDCKLIAFQPDGRPVLHPDSSADSVALKRVEKSKILLNLDHPDFNSKREQLFNEIARDVRSHENSAHDLAHQREIRDNLAQKLSIAAPFSVAARHYLSAYRYLDWAVKILNEADKPISLTDTYDRNDLQERIRNSKTSPKSVLPDLV